MCSGVITSLVDSVLDGFVNSKGTFTAYDVTKAVRKLTDEEFFHREVRTQIHDKMEDYIDDGSYVRETASVHPAFQYSPAQKVKSKKVVTSAAQITPKPTITSASQLSKKPNISTNRDSRNRYCVPNRVTREFGLASGDTVLVGVKSGQAVIARKDSVPLDKIEAILTVDCYDNIRIGGRVLDKLGLSGSITPKKRANRIVLS